MSRYVLEPEVAGGLGGATVANRLSHPPRVTELEYRFDGWLGDELLESFPCFIVSARIADALRQSKLSGFVLRSVRISCSAEFEKRKPRIVLPAFEWLDVVGTAGKADFGRDSKHRLVVSEAAKALLDHFQLSHCLVGVWDA